MMENKDKKSEMFACYLKNCIMESIGTYLTEDEINERLLNLNDEYIKEAEEYFYESMNKKNAPGMKEIVTTRGISSMFSSKTDFEANKELIKIIANYFGTKNTGKELTKIKFADKEFNSYASKHMLADNVIRQLSLILGEDFLVEILKMSNPYFTSMPMLGNFIDFKYYELCREIYFDLTNLITTTNLINYYEDEKLKQDKLIKEKLLPVYEYLKVYNPYYKNKVFKLVEFRDFDFKAISTGDIEPEIKDFTTEEKEFVKSYLFDFDKMYDNNTLIPSKIVKKYPPVRPAFYHGSDIYYKEDFSFINKFMTISNHMELKKYETYEKMLYVWKDLQDKIVCGLLPMYIKNNKEKDINLDEILKLATYNSKKDDFDLSKRYIVKKIKRKVKQA